MTKERLEEIKGYLSKYKAGVTFQEHSEVLSNMFASIPELIAAIEEKENDSSEIRS